MAKCRGLATAGGHGACDCHDAIVGKLVEALRFARQSLMFLDDMEAAAKCDEALRAAEKSPNANQT